MQEYSTRKRHGYGPFIRRLRLAVDCGVDFDRAPERSARFCHRTRIWALGIVPAKKQFHPFTIERQNAQIAHCADVAEPLCRVAVRLPMLWSGDAGNGADVANHPKAGVVP